MGEPGTSTALVTDGTANQSIEVTPADSDVAITVADKEEKREVTFAPGELKWTSDKSKEEPTNSITEIPSVGENAVSSVEKIEIESPAQETPRKRWVWAASLGGIFLISFLIGYTVLGGQYWREVFDIHTWIHLIKLLFG